MTRLGRYYGDVSFIIIMGSDYVSKSTGGLAIFRMIKTGLSRMLKNLVVNLSLPFILKTWPRWKRAEWLGAAANGRIYHSLQIGDGRKIPKIF
jgi:hypothetical protein